MPFPPPGFEPRSPSLQTDALTPTAMPAHINMTEKQNISEEKRNKINMMLEHSMKIQMGTIPETEFSQCILSNACLAVSGLLHIYFNNLGIQSDLGRYLI